MLQVKYTYTIGRLTQASTHFTVRAPHINSQCMDIYWCRDNYAHNIHIYIYNVWIYSVWIYMYGYIDISISMDNHAHEYASNKHIRPPVLLQFYCPVLRNPLRIRRFQATQIFQEVLAGRRVQSAAEIGMRLKGGVFKHWHMWKIDLFPSITLSYIIYLI